MMQADFLAIARGWLGTEWKHQGRKKGVGVDCVGFVSEVAREAGILDIAQAANYQRRPDGHALRAKLNEHLTPIRARELRPGDVVLIAFDRVETHVGLIGDHPDGLSLIHAYLVARKVVEHRLDESWRRRIVGCWRIPELDS